MNHSKAIKTVVKPVQFLRPGWNWILCAVILTGLSTAAMAQNPTISVRFANPEYNPDSKVYCLDVEFQSDTANQQLFGMNVRFFFEYGALEFLGFEDFEDGYAPYSPDPPFVDVGVEGSGTALFGFNAPAVMVNGAVQLVDSSAPPVYIETKGWTRLFKVCFLVSNANALKVGTICPAIVWDLEEQADKGGFLPGSDGVVVTVVGASPDESAPADEIVEQYNVQYNQSKGVGEPYTVPAAEWCISLLDAQDGDDETGSVKPPESEADPEMTSPAVEGEVAAEEIVPAENDGDGSDAAGDAGSEDDMANGL